MGLTGAGCWLGALPRAGGWAGGQAEKRWQLLTPHRAACAGAVAAFAAFGCWYAVPWRRSSRQAQGTRDYNRFWKGRAALELLCVLWMVSAALLRAQACRRRGGWSAGVELRQCTGEMIGIAPPEAPKSKFDPRCRPLAPASTAGIAAAAAWRAVGLLLLPLPLPGHQLDRGRLAVPGVPHCSAGLLSALLHAAHAAHVHHSSQVGG